MPTLSHSQIETWTQCPRRWWLQKVEGAPQAPSEALILGTAAHAVVEQDGRDIMAGHPWSLPELLIIFGEHLTRELNEADPNGLLPDETWQVLYAKGEAILRAYVTHLRPRYTPHAVEESFTADIPGAPGWRFTGRIDARMQLPDGTPIILDFKTGKPWQVGAEHQKPQATAYLMAEAVRPPLAQAQAVVFCVFPVEPDGDGGYTCTPQFRTTTRTATQVDAYARYLVVTAEQITAARRTGDFPARTGPLCGWCGVLGSCGEGQAWLASKGRTPAIPVVRRHEEGEGRSA